MPDPIDLLSVARRLSEPSGSQPSDAQLRRAVSTAYYALFHKVLRAAAQRFMGLGKESSAGYAILYRSFDHLHMRMTCEALDVSTLKDKLKRQLGRDAVSQDMRDFANAFSALQEARHLADYDPRDQFLPSDVSSLIDAADFAMTAFDQADSDERTDVLALMMVKTRG